MLARRLADRATAPRRLGDRRRQLDAALPRRLRPDVQPLPVHRDAVVPGAAACARARRPASLGALGALRFSLAVGDASLRRRSCSRRRRSSCSLGRAIASARPRWRSRRSRCSGSRSGSPTSCSPDASTSASAAAASGSAGRCRSSTTSRQTVGDFTAGWPPAIAAVVLATAAGGVLLWRERRRAAVLAACATGVPAAAFLVRPARCAHLAGVAPSHLRAAVRRRSPSPSRCCGSPRGGATSPGPPWPCCSPPRSPGPGTGRRRSSRASPVARRGTRRRVGLARGDEPAGRRALRLRPALPRRLGAKRRVPAHRRPACRRQARAQHDAGRRRAARARRLGVRRERHEQLRSATDDPAGRAPAG